MRDKKKSSLSVSQRQLVELMQEINFGCLKALVVQNGEPWFEPPPRIVRELKFGGENGPRKEHSIEDFVLKSQVTELFEALSSLGDGMVESLEVKHGLPFKMRVEGEAMI
ncbi:MAG: hypothetical protein QNJ97_27620 [Myxococcota bacterium]|nr:hypothetical protein [Myxococcota bacterium]